jgi:hypothetical protein
VARSWPGAAMGMAKCRVALTTGRWLIAKDLSRRSSGCGAHVALIAARR